MNQAVAKDSKEQILAAFNKLFAQYKNTESKVATKEEEAEKAKNQELLETVSNYTVDNIVNGVASLQLDFGAIVTELSQKLGEESTKLNDLRRAIVVESDYLEQIRKVRLVADALYILRQEHQEKMEVLASKTTQEQEAVEKAMAQVRKAWLKEQENFTEKTTEEQELLTKSRQQEADKYEYEIARDRKIEMDEYEEVKRQQERELAEEDGEKEKGWQEREKYLTDNQAEFAENEKKVEKFEEELKQAYIKAKEEAIKEATKEANVKANLIEKEWEAAKQGYELKVESLQRSIERQTEQINELTAQLQAATNQAQQLAMRAFQGSSNQ